MSMIYRVSLKETVTRRVTADDSVSYPIEISEILPQEDMQALLRESLATADEAGPMAGLARHFHQMRGAPLGDDLTAVLARRDA